VPAPDSAPAPAGKPTKRCALSRLSLEEVVEAFRGLQIGQYEAALRSAKLDGTTASNHVCLRQR
jgi:hypothetical protein